MLNCFGSELKEKTQPFSQLRFDSNYLPWQLLNFLPEPQGQGSLRPTFGS